jgi:UTP--glucose-1-phosphate uridylyltransferase
LQSLTDRDGVTKPALSIILDELIEAGIEKIGLVLAPGDKPAYEALLSQYGSQLVYLEQSEALGYGHAVLTGRDFVGNDRFLLQVCDHLYVSHMEASCTRQLLTLAETEQGAISAVQATHESLLRFYGTVAGSLIHGQAGLYQIENVIEKPTPTVAEQQCVVPGLRNAHYLCFFGMHILTPSIFDILLDDQNAAKGGKFGLTPALARLSQKEEYIAAEIAGRRSDLEASFGLLRAQIALGLNGSSREEVLTVLAEALAADSAMRR